MFHPGEWAVDSTFRRIFLSERNDCLFVIVDHEDWDWLREFSWSCHKQGDWGFPNYYARRTAGRNEDAPHGTPFYMHVEIEKLVAPPPTPKHVIVDHINGNTFDNRRANLRWVTLIENRANRHSFWRTRTPETVWTCPRNLPNTQTPGSLLI